MNENVYNLLESYINELYDNQNNTDTEHLKNIYAKAKYYDFLLPVANLLMQHPEYDSETIKTILREQSGITEVINDFVNARKLTPGMVVTLGTGLNEDTFVMGNKSEVIYDGNTFIPSPSAMDEKTIFDLASTSKVFTVISILKLSEAGLLELDDPMTKYLPEFAGLKDVTIYDLLTFMIPLCTTSRVDVAGTPEEAHQIILSLGKESYHDPLFYYSDMGSIALKYVIERITNMPLKAFVEEEIFKKNRMHSSFLNVPEEYLHLVANENYSKIVLADGTIKTNMLNVPGTPHDAKTVAMGHLVGNAPGHAGFFSTAEDLCLLSQNLIAGKLLNKENTLRLGQNVIGGLVELDSQLRYNSHHGLLTYTKQADPLFTSLVRPFLSGKAFASPGFTGTSITVDPLNEVYTFIGANRLHNRIYQINEAMHPPFIDESLCKTYAGHVISKSYTRDSAMITEVTMKLALQYKFLERYFKQKEKALSLIKIP